MHSTPSYLQKPKTPQLVLKMSKPGDPRVNYGVTKHQEHKYFIRFGFLVVDYPCFDSWVTSFGQFFHFLRRFLQYGVRSTHFAVRWPLCSTAQYGVLRKRTAYCATIIYVVVLNSVGIHPGHELLSVPLSPFICQPVFPRLAYYFREMDYYHHYVYM